jgi:hypothetical protein
MQSQAETENKTRQTDETNEEEEREENIFKYIIIELSFI